jgi:hypothetical protein
LSVALSNRPRRRRRSRSRFIRLAYPLLVHEDGEPGSTLARG